MMTGKMQLSRGVSILGFVTCFISITFWAEASSILQNGDMWYIWLGCAFSIVGGVFGFFAPCFGSATMSFYFLLSVSCGLCWWLLWIVVEIVDIATSRKLDGEDLSLLIQCLLLFSWGSFCMLYINRYYNQQREHDSKWCLCRNSNVKYCCCSSSTLSFWANRAKGGHIPDVERE